MKKIDQRILAEASSLVESGVQYLQKIQHSDRGLRGEELAEITTWVTRLGQLIIQLYGDNSQHYFSYTSALDTPHFYKLHSNYNAQFSRLVGVAKAIVHDLDNGLLVDLKKLIQADIFSDFLEMGEYLLSEGYKDASAVIIGSVLEDCLRKLAERERLSLVTESGKILTIEPLNVELAKRGVYSKLVQKQITTWAHVRNKAAHGEYGEYSKEQVQMMLLFVQSFASNHVV